MQRLHVSIHAPAWGATREIRICWLGALVSIHAPAWGATADRYDLLRILIVSIHAPAWGATVLARNDPRHSICFNPRSRVGSDDCRGFILVGCGVSIHAPAWGATVKVPTTESLQIVSIHAPAWGATLQGSQSSAGNSCFNPRSRVGSDF